MIGFGFQTAGEIAFGRGVSTRALQALSGRAERVLVVHGSRPAAADWLVQGLTDEGFAVAALSCSGEPTLAVVEAAVAKARAERVGAVVALGGGSVIDLGKAVAGLTPALGKILDHLEVVGLGRPLTEPSLPFIALPTTAGTGAEVTKNAVIGLPDHGRKVSLRSPFLLPDLALIDPALTDGAPMGVTMASGMDAVTQVIEAYVSCKASPLTDALCVETIPRGLQALLSLAQGEDAGARDAIAYTSLVGGMALANAGLGAVHGLAGVIGGRAGTPHGEICAALLPAVLEENRRNAPAGSLACQKLSRVLAMVADAFDAGEANACRALTQWMGRVGLRPIGALGVTAADIGIIAEQSVGSSSSKGNPIPLDAASFRRILEASHGQGIESV